MTTNRQTVFMKTMTTNSPEFRTVAIGQSLDISGMTSTGRRRVANEDSFLIAEMNRSMRHIASNLDVQDDDTISTAVQGEVLAVADGIKGGGHGDLASSLALRVIAGYMTNVMEWCVDEEDDERMREEFEAGFRRCQRRIRREAEYRGHGDWPVGTTLTLGYVVWPHLYLAHVGDSCAFLYRRGVLRRLTSPHTLAQRMIDRELIEPNCRAAKRFENVLVNSVGGGMETLDVEFHRVDLRHGDSVLLCTDGLLAHVDEAEIQRHLENVPSSDECCRKLVELANRRGGRDNITVVVARTDAPAMAAVSKPDTGVVQQMHAVQQSQPALAIA